MEYPTIHGCVCGGLSQPPAPGNSRADCVSLFMKCRYKRLRQFWRISLVPFHPLAARLPMRM